MKFNKKQLAEMVQEVIKSELNEMSEVDTRMSQLDRFKVEASVSTYEILEDVLEQLDTRTWKMVLAGIKRKYGYRG